MYQHGLAQVGSEPRWLVLAALERPQEEAIRPTETEPADARRELIERVRREIAEGTYDTPQRWEAALDRLCERLHRA